MGPRSPPHLFAVDVSPPTGTHEAGIPAVTPNAAGEPPLPLIQNHCDSQLWGGSSDRADLTVGQRHRESPSAGVQAPTGTDNLAHLTGEGSGPEQLSSPSWVTPEHTVEPDFNPG